MSDISQRSVCTSSRLRRLPQATGGQCECERAYRCKPGGLEVSRSGVASRCGTYATVGFGVLETVKRLLLHRDGKRQGAARSSESLPIRSRRTRRVGWTRAG